MHGHERVRASASVPFSSSWGRRHFTAGHACSRGGQPRGLRGVDVREQLLQRANHRRRIRPVLKLTLQAMQGDELVGLQKALRVWRVTWWRLGMNS